MNFAGVAVAESQPSARRAALTLHALSHEDRTWLLEQLPPRDSDRLDAMLEELAALGIPMDPSLMRDIVGSVPVGTSATHPEKIEHLHQGDDSAGQKHAALNRLDASVVAKVLDNEPAGLIARLVHSHPWAWRHALIAQLAPVKRKEVEELLDAFRMQVSPYAPRSLHRALVDSLYQRTVVLAALSNKEQVATANAAGVLVARVNTWMAAFPGRLRAVQPRRG